MTRVTAHAGSSDYTQSNSIYSAQQLRADALFAGASQESTRISTLGGMTLASCGYQILRTSLVSLGALRPLAILGALFTETIILRTADRISATLENRPYEEVFDWHSGFNTLFNLTTLKGMACLTAGSNPFVRYFVQSSALVGGAYVAGLFRMAQNPQLNVAEQFAHAGAMAFSMNLGNSLLAFSLGSYISVFERSMSARSYMNREALLDSRTMVFSAEFRGSLASLRMDRYHHDTTAERLEADSARSIGVRHFGFNDEQIRFALKALEIVRPLVILNKGRDGLIEVERVLADEHRDSFPRNALQEMHAVLSPLIESVAAYEHRFRMRGYDLQGRQGVARTEGARHQAVAVAASDFRLDSILTRPEGREYREIFEQAFKDPHERHPSDAVRRAALQNAELQGRNGQEAVALYAANEQNLRAVTAFKGDLLYLTGCLKAVLDTYHPAA